VKFLTEFGGDDCVVGRQDESDGAAVMSSYDQESRHKLRDLEVYLRGDVGIIAEQADHNELLHALPPSAWQEALNFLL